MDQQLIEDRRGSKPRIMESDHQIEIILGLHFIGFGFRGIAKKASILSQDELKRQNNSRSRKTVRRIIEDYIPYRPER